jgi:ribosomal protein L34E
MADKAKRRARELMAELGCSFRTARNILAKRTACSRAGHVENRDPKGERCTSCGSALRGVSFGEPAP